MGLRFDEAIEAAKDAERTLHNAEVMLRETAELLCGRLQSARINYKTLIRLKRELKNFNANTGEWK